MDKMVVPRTEGRSSVTCRPFGRGRTGSPLGKMAAAAALAAFLLGLAGGNAAAAPKLTVTSERIVVNEMPRGFANVNLMLVDVLTVRNAGDALQPQVEVPLAAGHQGLQIRQGTAGNPTVGEKSFVDPQPLAPGESRQYVFTYGLGYPRLPNFIERAILYPTDKLSVVVQAGQYAIEAPGLMKMGRKAMGGAEVEIYETMSPLSPNPAFEIRVDRGDRGISPWFWAWVALFAVPVLGLAAIAIRGRRVRSRASGPGSGGHRPPARAPSPARR